MLPSSANVRDNTLFISFFFSFQKNNIQELKEEIKTKLPANPSTPGSTGTLRHSHKKNRPAPPPPPLALSNGAAADLEIRDPSQLLVGVPATLTTQWRHRPHALVTGHVSYLASVSSWRVSCFIPTPSIIIWSCIVFTLKHTNPNL